MSQNDVFDGFSVVLEKKNEDWKAYFVDLPTVYGISKSSIQAIINAKIEWERYKEECKKNKKSKPLPTLEKNYSGQFNVRLDKKLHKALVNEAIQNNLSLNALIYKKLQQSTVIEKKGYRWKFNKATFLPFNGVLLSFSEEGNDREVVINLKFSRGYLGDILEDRNVSSESKLEEYIFSNKDLSEAFQDFISDQNFNGFVSKQGIIECVLISREEFIGAVNYPEKDLEEKFPRHVIFYIARVCN